MPFSDRGNASAGWWEGVWGAALGVFLIGALVFIFYRVGGRSRFLYDDINLIVLNTRIRDIAHFRELIASGRPVRSLTFMLDYALWGYNPRGYHLTNLFLHIISSSLLFLFIRRIFRNAALVALGAGLLFASHPAATEAVAAVSHRKEMLALVFMLLSLLAYYSASSPDKVNVENKTWPRPRWIYYLISFGAYFLALGSKQVAIVTPLLMWVTDFLSSHEPARKALKNRWWLYTPLLVLPFAFFLVKMGDWRVFGAFPAEGMFSKVYFRILLVSAWAITRYVRLILWPVHLHIDYFIPDTSPVSVIAGLAIFFGLLMAAWRVRRNPVVSFGLFWIPVNLAPVLNLVPANEPFAERYLYIPLAGGCLLLSVLLEAGGRRAFSGKLFNALLFIWIACLSSLWWMVVYWRYPEVTVINVAIVGAGALLLWGTMRLVSGRRYIGAPVARVALAGLIIFLLAQCTPILMNKYTNTEMFWNPEQYSEGIAMLRKMYPDHADKLDPQKVRASKYIRSAKGFTILAMALFAGAIGGMKPDKKGPRTYAIGVTLLVVMFGGLTYFRAVEWNNDRRLWSCALRENPNSSKAAINLGITSRKSDDFRRALWAYRYAARLDPQNALLHYNYGLALIRLGNFEEAETEFKETIKYEPRHLDAHLDLGNIYRNNKKFIAAANEYRQVLQLDPGNVKAMFNLALACQDLGEFEKAMEYCRAVLAIMPDFQKARNMCGSGP